MKGKLTVKEWLAVLLLGVSLVLQLASLNSFSRKNDGERIAQHVAKVLSRRMGILDTLMNGSLRQGSGEWMSIPDIPEDMVLYHYCEDTLQSWAHRFPVSNDDVSGKVIIQRLTNPRSELRSPLGSVMSSASFENLGPNWYVVKSVRDADGCMVIGGLQIVNSTRMGTANGVNPHFSLVSGFSVRPLSETGGYTITLDGQPLFKIIRESFSGSDSTVGYLTWLAFALFIIAILLFQASGESVVRTVVSLLLTLLGCVWVYFWGKNHSSGSSMILSPILYADGPVFYSLGAVLVINLALILICLCLYMGRKSLYRSNISHRTFHAALAISFCAAILCYTAFTLRSIGRNSSIGLELYKLGELSVYTGIVYISFLLLLASIPLLVQVFYDRRGTESSIWMRRQNVCSIAMVSVFAAFMMGIVAKTGLDKEHDRVEVWANRLSVDRDISLELQLRRVEDQISSDVLLSSLCVLGNTTAILNRITDSYMYRISQDYDIDVHVLSNENANSESLALFDERVRSGMPIFEGAHFLYSRTDSGHSRYSGLFTYYVGQYGVQHLLVSVEPKSNREDRGFFSLMNQSAPGKVAIPSQYSYAKYINGSLMSYKGDYSYPTYIDEQPAEGEHLHMVRDGYSHFVSAVSDSETIVISSERMDAINYAVAFMLIAMLLYLFMRLLFILGGRRMARQERPKYFKTRVSIMLVSSLILTLVVMASVSVAFVYRRNVANHRSLMAARISTVQAQIESRCRNMKDYRQFGTQEFSLILETISEISKADITLYTPSGKAFKSTAPEAFDRMLVGYRINENAFFNIVYGHKSSFINRENRGPRKFYSLYAPIFNAEGRLLAILSTPYAPQGYDFKRDAIVHSATILAVFILLLIIARFILLLLVGRIFKPLEEMGEKMKASSVENLEKLEYSGQDEISALVESYNRMVGDLSVSTHQLAQAERDKAWSAMARQVAHEIKNPLTPMKLQIQRIKRLKDRNDPDWPDKFDEASRVLLDHIDILSDTANDFSTFAKLYTEEMTAFRLDKLLEEEIAMFDNREGVEFTYMGLEDVEVVGPKPQLTRVFVNLMTNAVQAIEGVEGGKVFVSLRLSGKEGFYDIVFEDNGPGVLEENVNRLFVPNFTTKNGGSGLGLAISRSILERCGATISYSRSFSLGGACFTVCYPKK